jgi:hypothetical protein
VALRSACVMDDGLSRQRGSLSLLTGYVSSSQRELASEKQSLWKLKTPHTFYVRAFGYCR